MNDLNDLFQSLAISIPGLIFFALLLRGSRSALKQMRQQQKEELDALKQKERQIYADALIEWAEGEDSDQAIN